MTPQQSKRIRQQAFSLWEAAGRPHGYDLDHWLKAEREINDKKRFTKAIKASKPRKVAKASKPRKVAAKSPLAGTAKTAKKTTRAKTTRAKKK